AVLLATAYTVSRGTLVGLLGVSFVALWKASFRGRFTYGLTGIVLTVWIFGTLPVALQQRYSSLLVNDVADTKDAMAESAVASREQRMSLLWESLSMTMSNPLVGVGPGMFDVAAAYQAKRRGAREEWVVTHNTYTQVSSEAGLPALIFFVATLGCCIRIVSSVHKQTREMPDADDAAHVAYCLLLSLTAYA